MGAGAVKPWVVRIAISQWIEAFFVSPSVLVSLTASTTNSKVAVDGWIAVK
jgi:hypothetical protein